MAPVDRSRKPTPTTAEVKITVTEVTISSKQASATIKVNIDGKPVGIPVAPEIKAYWEDQFYRQNPTPLQKKRFATLMSIVRAAYIKGREDQAKENG